jgi:hypothetical protein
MLARAEGQPATSEAQSAAEQNIELAGKRTASGTRIGLNDDAPTPGVPGTGFASARTTPGPRDERRRGARSFVLTR